MVERLQGLRVLVVEDEDLIAELIADILETEGCVVVGPCMRLDAALEAVDRAPFDVALVDVSLAGSRSFPLADALMRQSRPFVFITGYGRGMLPAEYSKLPVVTKPFQSKDILDALAGAIDSPQPRSQSR